MDGGSKLYVITLTIADFPTKRSGENENQSEPNHVTDAYLLIATGAFYKDLSLYNGRTFRKTDLFRNHSRNRR